MKTFLESKNMDILILREDEALFLWMQPGVDLLKYFL